MTPNNIVNLSVMLGLDLIAVTDHNTVKNALAAFEVGHEKGLMVLPGMEIETSEEVHVVCLFPTTQAALRFEKKISSCFWPIKNRAEIYGRQIIMDKDDNPVGEEERLLLNALKISIDDVVGLVRKFGGAAFPAHIDRPSNSILSNLGGIPDSLGFSTVEVSKNCDAVELIKREPDLKKYRMIRNSDAHYLSDISMMRNALEVSELTAGAVLDFLNRADK